MSKLIDKILPFILIVFLISGCYHAKITTGETPSNEVYEKKWASSWIYGLVPPEVVKGGEECSNGVATVESKHSFLNMLVGGLTFGIYSPMHISVTCAEGSTALDESTANQTIVSISNRASEQDIILAFQQAADKAVEIGKPVYVIF